MARMKKSLAGVLETREDAETALGRLAEKSYTRDLLTAELDLKVKAIREQYEDKIAALNVEIDQAFDALSVWADGHPNEFPKDRKSLEMVHGTIGYRTGQPRLKTLRGWTWDKVAAAVQTVLPKYLRVRIEANKDALLDDRDALGERLADVGVSVIQDETFFVTPKTEVAL